MGPLASVDPDRLLLNWSHPRLIPVGDAEIAVHLGGHGQPVLLLPGFPNGPRAFMHLAERLAQDHYVILPYLPGTGPSQPPLTGGFSIAKNAARMWALCEHLGAREIQIVGHDFGGSIAYWMAIHHQQNIRRMVVLSTPLRGITFRHVLQNLQVSFPVVSDLLFQFASKAVIRRLYQLWSGPGFRLSPEQLEYSLATWAPPGNRRAALTHYRALGNLLAMNTFRDAWIKVPTMLIFGDRVKVLPRKTMEMTAEAFEKVKVNLLKDVGHFPHMERRDEVTDLIANFLTVRRKARAGEESAGRPFN